MAKTVNSRAESFLGNSSPLNDASWTIHLPVSMHELTAEVLEDDWDAKKTFDFHLRRAAAFWGEGIGCMETDPERAFVAMFRAADLLLVKLTTHPDYEFILNDSEREALFSTGETTFRELGELKRRILERQNARAAANFVNHSTPIQSKIKRPPPFVRANADNENHRWAPENAPLCLSSRPSPAVTSSPLQGWNTRPPTPHGPRALSMARPSPNRNPMRNHPQPLQHFADTPKPAPQENGLNLLRRCTTCAQLPRPPSELNLRQPSPFSGTKSPSWSPGPIPRIPSILPRTRLESLWLHQDCHPNCPNSSPNVDPLESEIKKLMKEVKAFETELARVNTQSASDRERLMRELRTAKQDNVALVDQVEVLAQRNDDATSKMKSAQADLRKLKVEKRGWQEQLDAMHHKVVQAERQIRCLDHLTRAKLEAREETIFGPTKRPKLAMTQKQSSSELINAFMDLNEEILQAANLLVENLDRTHYYLSPTELPSKAEKKVGTHVTQMLKAQAGDGENARFRQLLMMVVLEVFFVRWCSAIIEGFYPKRTTFADLLVELSAQTHIVTAGCGKQLRVVETRSTTTVQFPTWVSEIIRDLSDVLLIGGLKIRAQHQTVFTTKIQSIISLACNLRVALAEKDIYGGIELVVESPDSPFQTKWMEEAYTTERRGTLTMQMQMEPIAGTIGMGLKRTNVGDTQHDARMYLLKPKVVLARVLSESP